MVGTKLKQGLSAIIVAAMVCLCVGIAVVIPAFGDNNPFVRNLFAVSNSYFTLDKQWDASTAQADRPESVSIGMYLDTVNSRMPLKDGSNASIALVDITSEPDGEGEPVFTQKLLPLDYTGCAVASGTSDCLLLQVAPEADAPAAFAITGADADDTRWAFADGYSHTVVLSVGALFDSLSAQQRFALFDSGIIDRDRWVQAVADAWFVDNADKARILTEGRDTTTDEATDALRELSMAAQPDTADLLQQVYQLAFDQLSLDDLRFRMAEEGAEGFSADYDISGTQVYGAFVLPGKDDNRITVTNRIPSNEIEIEKVVDGFSGRTDADARETTFHFELSIPKDLLQDGAELRADTITLLGGNLGATAPVRDVARDGAGGESNRAPNNNSEAGEEGGENEESIMFGSLGDAFDENAFEVVDGGTDVKVYFSLKNDQKIRIADIPFKEDATIEGIMLTEREISDEFSFGSFELLSQEGSLYDPVDGDDEYATRLSTDENGYIYIQARNVYKDMPVTPEDPEEPTEPEEPAPPADPADPDRPRYGTVTVFKDIEGDVPAGVDPEFTFMLSIPKDALFDGTLGSTVVKSWDFSRWSEVADTDYRTEDAGDAVVLTFTLRDQDKLKLENVPFKAADSAPVLTVSERDLPALFTYSTTEAGSGATVDSTGTATASVTLNADYNADIVVKNRLIGGDGTVVVNHYTAGVTAGGSGTSRHVWSWQDADVAADGSHTPLRDFKNMRCNLCVEGGRR